MCLIWIEDSVGDWGHLVSTGQLKPGIMKAGIAYSCPGEPGRPLQLILNADSIYVYISFGNKAHKLELSEVREI